MWPNPAFGATLLAVYFDKLHHPANFVFADRYAGDSLAFKGGTLRVEIQAYQGNICHLRLTPAEPKAPSWEAFLNETELTLPEPVPSPAFVATFDEHGTFSFGGPRDALLQGQVARSLGISGTRWLFNLVPDPDLSFYGMGEKWGALEKTGTRTKFWNTDVWADFALSNSERHRADPVYASIPYLICSRGGTFFGILVDNPYAVFMATNAEFEFHAPKDARQREFFIGSDDGAPSLYFIVGPTLAELTRTFQQLVGVTPRPPVWALGHQQSRWGYKSSKDLLELAHRFKEHAIPNDGLWLDIDYMDAFRVFTFSAEHFTDPATDIARITATGASVVPILDPGVKVETGYSVYDQGIQGQHFCTTAEAAPFTGFVWPGAAHFPDFSLPETKAWWSRWVAEFASVGISGAWLDMNDPSVGRVEVDSMRFGHGCFSHASYHNQYATGMAKATHEGFTRASPDRRPFLLTRSASTSIARYAAVWTGDNVSNEAFLRQSIPTTLNLALSGVPFNGPDVPGFGGDADDDLMVRWYKACFLFPFLRNHSCIGTRPQEPWAFSETTLRIVRRLIRLRYKLLPYLYQLFIEQEASGDAILRPLLYDFEDSDEVLLRDIDDAFMVGPRILQAPCLRRDKRYRTLLLPAGEWYDARDGTWLSGGVRVQLRDAKRTTPLFVRDGSIIPMQIGKRIDNKNDLGDVELHVFLSRPSTTFAYQFDDGKSFDFRNGAVTEIAGTLSFDNDTIRVEITKKHIGFRPLRARIVAHHSPHGLPKWLEVLDNGKQHLSFEKSQVRLTGKKLPVRLSAPFVVE